MAFAPGPYGCGTTIQSVPQVSPAIGSSRQIGIDLETRGQYTYDRNGNIIYDSDVRQLVQLALGTVKGSCAIKDLGRDAEPTKIGVDFVGQKRAQITNALARLVNEGLISIEEIEPITSESRSYTRVRLVDRSNGTQFTLSI